MLSTKPNPSQRIWPARFGSGAFTQIAPFYLAQIVKTYRARYPQVDIVPSELMQDEIITRLETESLDLALTYDMGL